ncbi:MAG: hypothetical protein C0392_14655 [Syntrophus sp. (in: bacteria)]|nr:hypothetical protein [Syntrophus sp. (in: bacteria)]
MMPLLLCFVLALSYMPFFHCHAEGGPSLGHDHPEDAASYLGTTSVISSGHSHEDNDAEQHTHHTHFLVESQGISAKSFSGDNLKLDFTQYFLASGKLFLSDIHRAGVLIFQIFPGSHPKDTLPVFSGLSPPVV